MPFEFIIVNNYLTFKDSVNELANAYSEHESPGNFRKAIQSLFYEWLDEVKNGEHKKQKEDPNSLEPFGSDDEDYENEADEFYNYVTDQREKLIG